uniref:Integrase, catalytic region, zinc finger, CCHC-type, peptidase aspartic, catalytic n=1 Tax=Tanacetum cinerariifolium TaxID=118510 RepID=A0A6L2NGP1_TANCI|nr:integrase, catalytic region, zinc finger, CCHC-type, peptidase aspartic, catalytic [Tanacetum cinerariifolium]
MLLEGLELTKEYRESQLYDDFEQFRQHKGETIHDNYVWFAKLINDMRNIKMTMSRMQLNSKFVNNILLEWGRFVTAVKLNRGLKNSNYDQLYAYLKQHENRGQGNNARGASAAGYGGAQNRVGIEDRETMHGVQVQLVMGELKTELEYFKDKMLLMQAQENGDLALNVDNVFQADDRDAFDSDVDEAPTAQTMFMANLSSADPIYDEAGPSHDSDVLSEVHDHDHYQDAVCEHHEVYEMHEDVQPNYVVDSYTGYTSDSNMILYDQYVKDNAVFSEMHEAHTVVYARCLELETELSKLKDKIQKDDHEVMDGPDFDLVFEIKKLKASIQGKDNAIRKLRAQISQLQETRSEADHSVTPKVFAPGMYDIDVKPIPPRLRNNREVHLDYLKHLKESVETLREIVEEAKVERPLDKSLASACLYTKHSHKLLEYVIGTCPKDFNK